MEFLLMFTSNVFGDRIQHLPYVCKSNVTITTSLISQIIQCDFNTSTNTQSSISIVFFFCELFNPTTEIELLARTVKHKVCIWLFETQTLRLLLLLFVCF